MANFFLKKERNEISIHKTNKQKKQMAEATQMFINRGMDFLNGNEILFSLKKKILTYATWMNPEDIISSEIVLLLSHVWLFATPWTVAYQDPPSMGFSRQEYWSGLPFPSPGDPPDPGIEPGFPAL